MSAKIIPGSYGYRNDALAGVTIKLTPSNVADDEHVDAAQNELILQAEHSDSVEHEASLRDQCNRARRYRAPAPIKFENDEED